MEKFAGTTEEFLVKNIIDFFQDVPDPRLDRRKKHPLVSILVCAFCAVIADWLGLISSCFALKE